MCAYVSLHLPETAIRITPPDSIFSLSSPSFSVSWSISLPFPSLPIPFHFLLLSSPPILSSPPPVMLSWSRMQRTDGPAWAPSSSASSSRSRRPRWPPMLTSHRSWVNSANRARRRLLLLLLRVLLLISEHKQDFSRSCSLFFYTTQTKLHLSRSYIQVSAGVREMSWCLS